MILEVFSNINDSVIRADSLYVHKDAHDNLLHKSNPEMQGGEILWMTGMTACPSVAEPPVAYSFALCVFVRETTQGF